MFNHAAPVLTVRRGQPRAPDARRRDRRILRWLCSPSIRRPNVSGRSRGSSAALIAERRIAFAKLAKHVRIYTADLDAALRRRRTCRAGDPNRPPREPRSVTILRKARCTKCPASPIDPLSSRPREDNRGPNVGHRTVNRGGGPRGPIRRSCGRTGRGRNSLFHKGFRWSG